MAALGAQSIASSYEQLLHVDRDGGGNSTTHVAIKDGDNGTTFGFTIATDALMMSSTNRLEFGDTGTYIHQSADGVLDLVSDTEIEINATTIDINGAVAMDGAMTGGTNITISGELDAATLDISGNADIDGTLEADAYTVDGTALDEFIADTVGAMVGSNTETGVAVTYEDGDNTLDFVLGAAQTTITSLLAADIKIGEDDETKIDFETANEIHFYANNTEQVYVADNIFGPQADSDVDLGTTGVRWKDAFVDSITVTGEVDAATLDISGAIDVAGTANLDVVDIDGAVDMASTLTLAGNADFNGDLDVDGTTNLDAVDIDGAVQIDNTVTVGADDQGYDVIFYGDTASSNMTWDTSEDDLVLNDSRLFIKQDAAQTAMFVDQGADEHGIDIDTEATVKSAIRIIDPKHTTGTVLEISDVDAVTSGSAALFYSNSSSNTSRELVEIHNNNANADNAVCLFIQQNGADASIELAGNGSIKFPGTQGASSDANSLDDYEEGTWTPTIFNATSGGTQVGAATAVGRYVKIGQQVHLQGYFVANALNVSGNNFIYIRGLPFVSHSTSNLYSAGVVGFANGLAITAGHHMSLNVDHNGASAIAMQIWDLTTGTSQMTGDELSADGSFIFQTTYATN